jgi:hypothetical protein
MQSAHPFRLKWIDDIKILAGMLMLLDHSLLYFGHENAWPRMSVTRIVEPLYVFAFGYLLGRNSHSRNFNRWYQLIAAALAETLLHSLREGQLYFGILASLALVWPAGRWIVSLSGPALLALTIGAGALALVPPSLSKVTIDYDLGLVIFQVSMTVAFQRRIPRIIPTASCLWLAQLTALGWFSAQGTVIHANVWTLLIGHPLAILSLIAMANQTLWRWPEMTRPIATHPLTFYVGHLALLTILAAL